MAGSFHEMTDEQLMLECQKDALDAFNLLFHRYRKRIYNFCIRIIGDEQAAEEITLDTFVKAYRARGRYKPTARFSTWLYCIARNLCRDALKSRAKDRVLSESIYKSRLPAEVPSNPGDRLVKEELQAKVRGAVQSLPEKQREVIIMSYYEGLTYSEIAAILKCSLGSVKMAAHRAHLKLGSMLAE